MTFKELLKPSFEVNFWLKHFRGLDNISSRAYEAYLMQPASNSMFFTDTTDYADEDFIDCTDMIELGYPPEYPEQIPEYFTLEDELTEDEETYEDDEYYYDDE